MRYTRFALLAGAGVVAVSALPTSNPHFPDALAVGARATHDRKPHSGAGTPNNSPIDQSPQSGASSLPNRPPTDNPHTGTTGGGGASGSLLARREHSLYPRILDNTIARWNNKHVKHARHHLAKLEEVNGGSSGGGSLGGGNSDMSGGGGGDALTSREVGMEKLRSRDIRDDRLSARDEVVQLVARALGDELAMREVGWESSLNTRNIDELD